MLEQILIYSLATMVVVLSVSILVRWRKTKGAILLDEKAINELISSVVDNAKAGRLPDIAGRVSRILGDYLKCSKIAFLKLSKFKLKTNHVNGVRDNSLRQLSFTLTPELQARLRTISEVTEISELNSILPPEIMLLFKGHNFNYFFSVFLRNNLFGVYFIKTDLSSSNASLKFLTTALAFSLSAAYHIRQQEKKLKKYENQLKNSFAPNNSSNLEQVIARRDLNRYLKIKNSQELVTELTKALRKEGNFDKMAFYVNSTDNDNSLISVNLRVKDSIDKVLKENYDIILDELKPGEVYNLKDASQDFPQINKQLGDINDEIDNIAAIPWLNNQKAVLAWNDNRLKNDIKKYVQDYWRNAIPLIEYVGRYERAKEMSYTDGLTGVYNHRYFHKRLTEELQRAARYGRSLTLLILDVDDLKIINDNYGHPAGDILLRSLANILSDSVRSIDLISRYGGDEFCLIMSETSRNRARLSMNRIRSRIASNPIKLEGVSDNLQYSVSIGGAVYPVDAESVDDLIKAADKALLQAKAEGRNCSRLFESKYNLKSS